MTFSQTVKKEILKSVRGIKGKNAEAFLQGVFRSSAWLSFGFGGVRLSVDSENPEFLHFCGELTNSLFGIGCKVESSNVNAKGTAVYTARFDGNLAERLEISYDDDNRRVKEIMALPDCKRAFVQALFVASGSVVIPKAEDALGESKGASRYHLELRFTNDGLCDVAERNLCELGFKRTARKNCSILYLKDSEKIADFLVYVNAMSAKLKLENVIIGRSMRNTANRQSNCISANIEKAVAASEKQLAAIRKLKASGRYEELPQQLKDAAEVRINMPEATLEEIAAALHISKSGASHRLKKLTDLSD